ncbi:Potassium channel [Puttea exsequens]|nr:Potassium channel [Puttea exsequens]
MADSSPQSSDAPGFSSDKHGQTPTALIALEEKRKRRKPWAFNPRPVEDDEPQDWWFCSTAIPLLAATTGPLANVMSIAALVTSWRNNYDPTNLGVDADSVGFPDPKWCLGLNGASLACGFVGNIFLLFNFTQGIRYIVALPVTIILWYFATGILMGITISMNEYVPPIRPEQTYSQGYWHAVIAACLYMASSMALMLNMLGYFLGHYPQHFELTDDQRNLILQTMMFFFWLAGGAAVFAKTEGWSYVDSLYFCDVTVLTVGFGDFHPMNDVGRGLVFPYSVGGIIILGLMVSSIQKFASELGSTHVVQKNLERKRTDTLGRTATSDLEAQQLAQHFRPKFHHSKRDVMTPSAALDPSDRTVTFHDIEKDQPNPPRVHTEGRREISHTNPVARMRHIGSRKPKIIMMRDEKTRFDAMRSIQHETHKFKRYSALAMSVIACKSLTNAIICFFTAIKTKMTLPKSQPRTNAHAVGILWCVGAIGFWKAEAKTQGLSYFQALYFCYVSLLTIGYGDLSPTSNAGKPFFIVWSLIAVPTMTILISDMGDTVIASFKRGTFRLADWTVLPKEGQWRNLLERYPWLLLWLEKKSRQAAEKKRLARGMRTGPADEDVDAPPPTMEEVANLETLDDAALARKLAIAIRRTADDLKEDPPKRYSYEEWAEYTRLIRFSRMSKEQVEEEEEEEGIVEWDWIGEDSPMLAEGTESEWVLDRLCESLNRYMRKSVVPTGSVNEIVQGNGIGSSKKDD